MDRAGRTFIKKSSVASLLEVYIIMMIQLGEKGKQCIRRKERSEEEGGGVLLMEG